MRNVYANCGRFQTVVSAPCRINRFITQYNHPGGGRRGLCGGVGVQETHTLFGGLGIPETHTLYGGAGIPETHHCVWEWGFQRLIHYVEGREFQRLIHCVIAQDEYCNCRKLGGGIPETDTLDDSARRGSQRLIADSRRVEGFGRFNTPINVYTRFCLNTAKSKFSLVSPVAD